MTIKRPLITTLATLFACTIFAAEIRVALLPTHRITTTHTQAQALQQLLAEWADEHKHIRAVDSGRCSVVVSQIRNGALTIPRARHYEAFNAIHPIDAWIDMNSSDNGATLMVTTATGTESLELTTADLEAIRKTMRRCAVLIEQTVGATPDPAAFDKFCEFDDDTIASAYAQSAVYIPGGSGGSAMEIVEDLWSVEKTGPAIASRIIDALRQMHEAAGRRKPLYTQRHITMAKAALPRLFNTPFETSAVNIIKANSEWFEADLLKLAKKAGSDDIISLDDIMSGDTLPQMAPAALPDADPIGAVRMLGHLTSTKSLNQLVKLAKSNTVATRTAAAIALSLRSEPEALAQLRHMTTDKEKNIAFIASTALWLSDPEKALPPLNLARQIYQSTNAFRTAVSEVISAVAEKQDVALLQTLATSKDDTVRRPAVTALLKLAPDDTKLWQAALTDPDSILLRNALYALQSPPPAALLPLLKNFCNDPQVNLAEAALTALAATRPTDKWQALAFDLDTTHPWTRRKIVAQLAAEKSTQSLDLLSRACNNRNPRTSADALVALTSCDAAAGLAMAVKALDNPHRRIRLQAAALIDQHSANGGAAVIHKDAVKAALEKEKNRAVRSYLESAQAQLFNTTYTPAEAARNVAERPALTWLCGMGKDAATSVYGAYYCTSIKVSDIWREAHNAGKICFGRLSTVGSPGLAILDPSWEDRSWIGIEAELPHEDVVYIDGVVYGEESMNFRPDSLWQSGWRLFALEAGLDPNLIKGDIETLSATQRRAWSHWAAERHIDGFNQLYDDTKLLYGKIRPGLQVATFMTEESLLSSGPNPADLRWKFDVGGIYDYKGSNRIAYYLIRRIKTLWPDRPIIWLSLGIGGYEMNPVKYSLKTPTSPWRSRSDRAYADSITAWLAGADVGWFSTWIFVRHDFAGGMANLSGVQIHLEDIHPGNELIARGIEFAYKDVEKIYAPVKPPKADDIPGIGLDGPTGASSDLLDAFDAEATRKKEREIAERIAAEKIAMKDGFLFYRYYIDSAARILNDLPRRNWHSQYLGVRGGLSVWVRGDIVSETSALGLLPDCDFLVDLNKLPDLDINRYRTIVVGNTFLLTDATINTITTWLRDKPNLLIVHPWLLTGENSGVATTANLDGKLTLSWPWKGEITVTKVEKPQASKNLELQGVAPLKLQQGSIAARYNGDGFKPLWQHNGETVTALWRKPGFAGAVIFDGMNNCSSEYLDALRTQINALAAEGIGLALPETAYAAFGQEEAISAVATTPISYARHKPLNGIDLLSGTDFAGLSGGRKAAVTATTLDGSHVVAHNGIVVLSTTPVTVKNRDVNNITITSEGLMQIGGQNLTITAASAPLPERKPNAAWLFLKPDNGIATQTWEEDGTPQQRWFIHSTEPVTITRQP